MFAIATPAIVGGLDSGTRGGVGTTSQAVLYVFYLGTSEFNYTMLLRKIEPAREFSP
jgi:hypothetical protein